MTKLKISIRRIWVRGATAAHKYRVLPVALGASVLLVFAFLWVDAQENAQQAPHDAVMEAQQSQTVPIERPEQQKTEHDRSNIFNLQNAQPSSPQLKKQPGEGKTAGFDFYYDPLNSEKPGEDPGAIMQRLISQKATVNALQRQLLESRYNLNPKLDPKAKMSRGKPLAVGPTARLKGGLSWDQLSQMTPDQIKQQDDFPYPSLPHPLMAGGGGQTFPQMQVKMFPRLQRYDVDFDLPEVFLPEFPPAIFLINRPELGDVSRGEVLSINNYYRLFKPILTAVQLDGMRLLLTPFPQEEFNPTDDRKSKEPSLGVTCLDCYINFHTTGQFHVTPDIRPEERRFRLDTVSLRGVFNQQIFGSKRGLRSVEDFTEFEQRTAYFNGDEIHAIKKGMNILDRIQVSHMAQMQKMIDFPPAPKLDPISGHLIKGQATEAELRGEQIFFGQGQCSSCHTAPLYMDNQMHDLHLERFLKNEPGDGPMKTFSLRGIKDSPPYLHDGRCFTLEDTVEFFNIVQQLRLSGQEKSDLVEFLRAL